MSYYFQIHLPHLFVVFIHSSPPLQLLFAICCLRLLFFLRLLRLLVDLVGDVLEVNVHRRRIDIGPFDPEVAREDGPVRRRARERRGQYLVSRLELASGGHDTKRQLLGRGGAARRAQPPVTVGREQELGESLLELLRRG